MNKLIVTNNQITKYNEQKEEFYALFEVNNRQFALKSQNVLEIIKLIELEYPNKMPSCFLGLMEYSENPVGVLDLRDILKMPRVKYDINSKIIVYRSDDTTISFICDKVLDIKKLNKEKISLIPYQQGEFFEGLYINKAENIYILNPKGIVDYIENNPEVFEYKTNPEEFLPLTQETNDILKNRKNFLKKTTQSLEKQTPLYDMGVSFKINDIKYYINMASVKEFFKVNNSKFIKLPSVPNYIFGLINIKGEYITVLDIRKFYGDFSTEIKEKSTIIIINSEDFKLGILADEILESMNINFEEIIQNKIQKQEELPTMEFVKNNEIYQVLNVDQLLEDERLTLC